MAVAAIMERLSLCLLNADGKLRCRYFVLRTLIGLELLCFRCLAAPAALLQASPGNAQAHGRTGSIVNDRQTERLKPVGISPFTPGLQWCGNGWRDESGCTLIQCPAVRRSWLLIRAFRSFIVSPDMLRNAQQASSISAAAPRRQRAAAIGLPGDRRSLGSAASCACAARPSPCSRFSPGTAASPVDDAGLCRARQESAKAGTGLQLGSQGWLSHR